MALSTVDPVDQIDPVAQIDPVEPVDPVDLEVIKGGLRSAQGEMEALLERTAMSPFIREKKDYFVGLFDRDGRMVLGTSMPLIGNVLQPIFAHYPAATMQPGDIYWYNDCYGSGGAVSHSPDQVFVTPVFAQQRLVAFVQSWAHLTDIGGMRPGSISPDATDIFQEGIIVPPVRMVAAGVLNEELFRTFVRNSRYPDMLRGDLRALSAAVRLGEKRLLEIMQRFGPDTVCAAFAEFIRRTEHAIRVRLRETFRPGRYRFADSVDSDGQGGGPYSIRMEMQVAENRIEIDTTASDDQAGGAINYLMHPSAPKMVLGIYFISADPSLLFNEGAVNAIEEVKVRTGSILQPRFPAALGQRGNVAGRMQSACLGLINLAMNGDAVAASGVYVINFFRGNDPRTGKPFLLSDGVAVGYGARPFADGIDAVYYVAQKNYPAEFLELGYPVRVRRYAMNCDSGGPGRWRGGCGVVREFELLADRAVFATRMEGVTNPPWGANGGKAARPGRYVLNPGCADEREVAPLGDGFVMKKGDVLRVETGGGGGWGHPYDREPERVLRDVLSGFVSRDSALADYGVSLRSGTDTIDEEATARIRESSRWPTKLFHRREYFDEVAW